MKMYQLKAAQVLAQIEDGGTVRFTHQGHEFTITKNPAWMADLLLTEVANGKTYGTDYLADLKEMVQLTVDCHKERQERQRSATARREHAKAAWKVQRQTREFRANNPVTVRELQVKDPASGHSTLIGRVAYIPFQGGFIFYPFVSGRKPSTRAHDTITSCIPRWAKAMKADLVAKAELLPAEDLQDRVQEVWSTCWDQDCDIRRACKDLGISTRTSNLAHLEARIMDDQGNLRLMPHTPGAWDNHCQ